MSEQHEATPRPEWKATPEQWARQEELAAGSAMLTCLLELRGRVKALEATQHAHVDTSHLSKEERDQILQELAKPARVFAAEEVAPIVAPSPAGSLVERVADALYDVPLDSKVEARAAIREVAAWLREQNYLLAATALTQEANR